MSKKRTSMLDPRAYNARVLAVCSDGKIFVIIAPDGSPQLPGGGSEIEDEGDPRRTLIRELGEETGVRGVQPERLRELCRRDKSNGIQGLHISVTFFLVLQEEEYKWYKPETDEGTVLRVQPAEFVQSGYFARMTKHQKQIIQTYISGEMQHLI